MDKEYLGVLEKWSQLKGMEWVKSDRLGTSSENWEGVGFELREFTFT